MPQLMPLNWVFSVFMIVFMLMLSFTLFFKKSNSLELEKVSDLGMELNWLW